MKTYFITNSIDKKYQKRLLTIGFAAILSLSFLNAQTQDSNYSKPSWYFGIVGGANFNFYEGSTQELNADFTSPTAFRQGKGAGLFLAPMVEYSNPNNRFGLILQAGYDNRKGKFDQVISPCNCPANLNTNLTYVTFEPSLKFSPFKSSFYLYGGPRFAFVFDKSFTFEQGTNPAFPEQVANEPVKGDFSKTNESLISVQVGVGYDIYLSPANKKTQFVLSPFVSFHPYIWQDPRSIETWNITTLRVGTAIKLGMSKQKKNIKDKVQGEEQVAANNSTNFIVNSPKNIPIERQVRETFPIRNYVFFDLGSTQIPDRYVLLTKDSVSAFKEEQIALFTPKNLGGRADRQMVVYYNILNILGDRMIKNKQANITLVGSSEESAADGVKMAESIKTYLTSVWVIGSERIRTEGNNKPKLPSQQNASSNESVLLKEGDRRVSIESSSPAMLMEFSSGPSAPLKPIEIKDVQKAPIESYVTFNNAGAEKNLKSWTLELKDKDGKLQNFGPYTKDVVLMPGQNILGSNPTGDYTVTMIGIDKKGKIEKKESKISMVLWKPPVTEEVMRFSVIYEFNESNAITQYEKYLKEVVIQKIPMGGLVIIHGHTDAIGDAAYNERLSWARANDVKTIMENGLKTKGRSDVSFQILGLGEDETAAPFNNKYPEERFYNRTVVIDIIPKK
jgi:outer membrane protein OmpA-like peptidoglycan-associated protein